MKRKTMFILVLIIFSSCKQTLPTDKEKRTALLNEAFDKSIIAKLNDYKSLKDYIQEKADTLIKQNDNIPLHIKSKLDQLRDSIGENNIQTHVISEDRIAFEVKITESEKGLYLSHVLIWPLKTNTNHHIRDYHYIEQKDSILNSSCVYTIGLLDHNAKDKVYGPTTLKE